MTSDPPKIIIAIDGYSSSGKSSMAKWLAAAIGYRYVDTGAMYRAVTLYAMRHSLITPDGIIDLPGLENALADIAIDFLPMAGGQHTLLNGQDVESEIRSMAVSSLVSPIAAVAAVRRDLVRRQQTYGREKGIVMDGRDIGTTVFPQAELKIFVNAPAEVRAQRRYKELTDKGIATTYADILDNVRQRDHIDSTRAESPLRQAPDAVVLDNGHMTPGQQNEWLLDQYRRICRK